MKILKTLTVTIASAAALAFCASNVNAVSLPVTTNYDTVTFSATLITNISADFEGGSAVTKSQKLVNKDLLNILTNSDFAGMPFPAGAKLVIGLDWGGDVLVIDKNGSNVLFDATYNNGNSNVATVVINPYNQTGAAGFQSHATGSESEAISLTWYNNGSFQLYDQNAGVNITGTGPCTEHFAVKSTPSAASWTDSQTFAAYGANETNGFTGFISPPGTLSGKITLSGHGKGIPDVLLEEITGHL